MKAAIINYSESPDGRVELLKEMLERKKFNVNVITSDFSHYTKSRIDNLRKDYVYLHTTSYKRNLSLRRVFSIAFFSKKVHKYLLEHDYDLVWLLLPPNIIFNEVVKAKKNKGFRLIADIEDLWPESLPIDNLFKKNQIFNYWRNLRNKNLKYSDYVVTECNAYRKYIFNFINPNYCSTLYLAKEGEANKIYEMDLDKSKIKIAYLGSINNIIDIDGIVSVINNFSKKYHVEVEIIGDGENRDSLLSALGKINNTEIHFYGRIFDEKRKSEILRQCNFGINMMNSNVVVGFTMKSLDYLKNGLFLLNNIKFDTWNFVDKNKIGLNIRENIDLDYKIINKSFSIKERNKIIDFYNHNFSEKVFMDRASKIVDNVNEKNSEGFS